MAVRLIMEVLTAISLAVSTVCGFIAGALGGFDSLLQSLILVMGMDIITGVWVSVHYKRSCKTQSGKFSSKALRHGIGNKILILLVVAISVIIDQIAGLDLLRNVTVMFYIIEEAVSILENVALMGVPLPRKLIQVLDILDEEAYVRKDEEPIIPSEELEEIFTVGNKDKMEIINNIKKKDNQP